MGRSYTDGIEIAQPLNGKIIKRYKQLALDSRVWLSLGGFQETCDSNPSKRYSKKYQDDRSRYTHRYK